MTTIQRSNHTTFKIMHGNKYCDPDFTYSLLIHERVVTISVLVFVFILTSSINTFNLWTSQYNNMQNTRQYDINVKEQTDSNYNKL
jgi:hypothetical protein